MRASAAERARADAVAERIVQGALEDGRALVASPSPALARALDHGWLARVAIEAEDHYAHFALPDAWAVLESALGRLDREGAAGASTPEIVELFLLRARVAQAMSEPDRASQAARAALAVAPDLVVDPHRHPPTLTALVEAERAAVTVCPLSLELAPDGALASVDGAAPAPAPATLPCAAHWITVSAPACSSESLRLETTPDAPALRLALALDPGAALALGSEPFAPPTALHEAAATALGRELVFLDVAREGEALVVSLGDRRVRASALATPDEIVSLLRAAGHVERGPDVGLIVGVSIGAGVALAVIVAVSVATATAPQPTSLELRGRFLP